jgi:hypothetical protein
MKNSINKLNRNISKIEEKYQDNMAHNNIKLLKKCNMSNYNDTFSRSIISSYADKNQFVYNFIYSCVKKNIQIFLNNDFSDELLLQKFQQFQDKYYNKEVGNILSLIDNNEITIKNYYYKFIYIFFLYLGMNRNIINFIQMNLRENYNTNTYGVLYNYFFLDGPNDTTHGITLDRFVKYNSIYDNDYNDIFKLEKINLYDRYIKFILLDSIKETFDIVFKKNYKKYSEYIETINSIFKPENIEILCNKIKNMIKNINIENIIYFFMNTTKIVDLFIEIISITKNIKNLQKLEILKQILFNLYEEHYHYHLDYLLEKNNKKTKIYIYLENNKFKIEEKNLEYQYYNRINYNLILSTAYKNFSNIEDKSIRIYFKVSNDIIPSNIYDNYNNEVFLNIQSHKTLGGRYVEHNNYLNTNIDKGFKYYYLGNYSHTLNDRLSFINIMLYCLKELDNNKLNLEKIELNKKLIIVFYYILILLMPFIAGTASIAEVALYSLWEKYIPNSKIKINPNVILDTEALSLPFNNFLHNCFNKEEIKTSYFNRSPNKEKNIFILSYFTPYLIVTPLNSTNINNIKLSANNNF